MSKIKSAAEVAEFIKDGAVIAVNSSSGLCCPDEVLAAIGARFRDKGGPRGITTIHPIAAGDMFGTKGVDHVAQPGLLSTIIGGSFPSGPSSMEPPLIRQMISDNQVAAYNVPSGIIFDMLREGAALRPGVMTQVGMETFVDPQLEGCAINEAARQKPIVERITFKGQEWLYFNALRPDVSIIRASTADERGNLTFENEGAYIGAMEIALAGRNSGGIVIAQVKRVAQSGTLRPHDVRVPGILVDYVVEAPEQLQTTATPYDPAISGEVFRPLDSFSLPEFDAAKVMARRVAQELKPGWAVNIGFGISANVPRILLEEGRHGEVTWVIEQGAVGGIPLLDFKFGCSSNAECFVASPQLFTYFQAGGFDVSLMSFLQIDRMGSVNVSNLAARPHVTAGAGGFVDITSHAKRIIFSGYFNAGAKLGIADGKVRVDREGRVPKIVEKLDQTSFSGPRAIAEGKEILYVTERCVMKLTSQGLMVTEIAPGIDLQSQILDQAEVPLLVSSSLKEMDGALFQPSMVAELARNKEAA
ncbi:acyl CoA:acetate/3-ketoacid CoA transferase [Acetobacter tropicalis]|uniref:Acetate CoA-transferase YdiF n=1 Tax=Acetobacter tropicalis TaxID=104102 RepID=A0A094YG51_9PROT|nr:CoA-transferase [Acetobacter tropicalis]KAA8383551.1 acyl CoA:acetate/3-ketoacid CoA transferase [Acetobacter tropicalis]KAA8389334.1 acyl CoA:acetate/3-ketoacid CoA transferase [Acetobacter tropicalis]KGB21025.1 Propionate CoA-transferase [Acetobacter tropicalis]MBC9008670.1 malonate decarboxylase subunit alpha [Acetobacter tropicalis]MDO8173045.1 CoA-transferase [Acetobacter tropicalis]